MNDPLIIWSSWFRPSVDAREIGEMRWTSGRAALWDAVMWGVAIVGAAVVLKDTPYFFGVFVVLAGCAAGSSTVLHDCRRRSKPS